MAETTRSTTRWDATLDTDPCDRYNNAELTLALRIHSEKVEPAGATGLGSYKLTHVADIDPFWTPALWRYDPRTRTEILTGTWHTVTPKRG